MNPVALLQNYSHRGDKEAEVICHLAERVLELERALERSQDSEAHWQKLYVMFKNTSHTYYKEIQDIKHKLNEITGSY